MRAAKRTSMPRAALTWPVSTTETAPAPSTWSAAALACSKVFESFAEM
jgi:hypothetical protein